jgi:hypothetical protein
MPDKDITILDFDSAVALAIKDPVAFEEYRLNVIEALISRAPERTQLHLRRLQWRIKQVKRSSPNPFEACLKLQQMMWHSVAGHSGSAESLEYLNESLRDKDKDPSRAKVLVFKPKK